MKIDIPLNTEGRCLFCLNKVDKTQQPFSFRVICHYLKIKVNLSNEKLIGNLCKACGQVGKTLSEIFVEMEALKMQLDYCVAFIHDKIRGEGEIIEVYSRLITNFRKDVFEKCAKLMAKAKPRVLLERLNYDAVPIPVNVKMEANPVENTPGPPETIDLEDEVPGAEEEEAPPETKKPKNTSGKPRTKGRKRHFSAALISKFKSPKPYWKRDEKGYVMPSRRPRECPICHKMMHSVSALNSHNRTVHLQVKYPCDLCPAKLTTKFSLEQHKEVTHFKKKVETNQRLQVKTIHPRKYQCPDCPKRYTCNKFLNVHRRVVHQGHKFQCDLCPEEFLYKDNVRRHKLKVHGINSFRLPTTVRFATTYKCDFCPRHFENSNHLKIHRESTHLNIRWRCEVCFSVLALFQSLKRHMQLTHKIKVIQGQSVKDGVTLYSKIKEGQSDSDEESEAEQEFVEVPEDVSEEQKKLPEWNGKEFKCPQCEMEFKKLSGLRTHQTVRHLADKIERRYECDLCDRNYVTSDALHTHRKGSHPGAKYQCKNCQEEFLIPRELKKHAKMCEKNTNKSD